METTDPKIVAAALKRYDALRRAQKKYYEKKAGPVESRRPRGRPKKGTEGVVGGVGVAGGQMA